ncbi:hypothetical protein A5810_001336, partial [Enterococcus faecium]
TFNPYSLPANQTVSSDETTLYRECLL